MFPVEEKIDEIRRHLAANRDVVLTAPPGSGKTTCVPPALLDEPWLAGKRIVMLEPRRLAARNCATYVAGKLGEPVGGTVGYQVRLERRISSKTRLEIVTEGLLTNRILADPELADVGLVIFDEFHERSLQCDLAYALVREVKNAFRPDLRIIVMSATLDVDEVFASLATSATGPQPARVSASGRMFPVETRYLGDLPMSAAISRALKETDGDILCFLPGEGEIRRIIELSNRRMFESEGVVMLPLYGALPKEEQDRVFQPLQPSTSGLQPPRRKVVLATSIAETSVTIEGIVCVIDSGLMRVPRFSPSTGMSRLVTLPLSQDRAEQRRGRAGRVRPGVCYRLWTEGDQQSRSRRMTPEILDADLCSLVLSSAAWGALGRESLPWMTVPSASLWDQAVGLLKLLGALDADGRLTPKGERMAKLPMHPRLANMVLERVERFERCERCERFERGDDVALLAAIIEEGAKTRETDIRRILDLVKETPNRPDSRRLIQLSKRFSHFQPSQSNAVDKRSPKLVGRASSPCALEDASILSPGRGRPGHAQMTFSEGSSLALAYPDRIAKNRGNGTFRMVNGRGAFLPEDDPLAKAPYLVCCDLDDRPGDAKVFLGCPIDEDEILDLFGDQVVEVPFCEWDRRNDRVKSVVRRKLGEMVLGEAPVSVDRSSEAQAAACVAALVDGIRQKGVENLPCWSKESLQFRARVAFLHRVFEGPEPRREGAPETFASESFRREGAPETFASESFRREGAPETFASESFRREGAPETFAARPRAAQEQPESVWPELTDDEILSALEGFVGGMTKWRDLERLDLFAVMETILLAAGHDRRELDRLAPVRMEVPSGSHMTVHYEGDEPTVEVRLQECFGLMETPKVAGGRVPIVMTLLSPAQRPIQITKDLSGFWQSGYQLVRKDMRGRYPKHYWPEDPFTAVATRRVRPNGTRGNT